MKSDTSGRQQRSGRHTGGAIRLIVLMVAVGVNTMAQMVPAGIITTVEPTHGRAVFDGSGNAYYFGGTPTAGAAQTESGGGACVQQFSLALIFETCPDAAVLKADASGKQIWGTLLGGPTADNGTGLAVDAAGNVLVTGSTGGQFPTTPNAIITSSTTATVFAAKISADGSKFLYSTYLPPALTASSAIAVDAASNAYIAGMTSSGHAYALKLSADGSSIIYYVTLAGSGVDSPTNISVASDGSAVIAGTTTSADFPVTAGAFQNRLKGEQNAFVVKLDPAGRVVASTYFGGSGSDSPSAVGTDSGGNIILAGATTSLDLPTTQGTMEPSPLVPMWNEISPGGFAAKVASDGTSLEWATYVMSSDYGLTTRPFHSDVGVVGMAVTAEGDIYLDGLTGPGFPVTPSAPLICFPGATTYINAFLAHLNSNGALVDATYLGNSSGLFVDSVGGVRSLSANSVLVSWNTGFNGFVSNVQFGSGGWVAPACLSNAVLNAATLSATQGVAPAELVTLTGFGIGPDTGVGYQPDAQGDAPTQLAGVQVFFDGTPSPILYAQSRQINAITPSGLTVNGTTRVTVTYNNQQFGPEIVPVTFADPGIFRLQLGQSTQAGAINEDGTLNGRSHPAPRGSIVTVWGTGFGETNPPCSVGALNNPEADPLSPSVQVGVHSGAQILYSGSTPGSLCGIVQINFQVPLDSLPGTLTLMPSLRHTDVAGPAAGSFVSSTIWVK